MTKEEILKILDETSKSLMFNLRPEEQEYLLNNFDAILKDLDAIKNFDLTPYKEYAYVDDKMTQPMSRLREDEEVVVSHPEEYFKNAVKFEGGMVVVKNEK